MSKTTYIFIYTLKGSQLDQEEAEEFAEELLTEMTSHILGEEEAELGVVIPVQEKD